MRKIERLRREALKQATARGHVMRRFEHFNRHHSLIIIQSQCILCGQWLCLDTEYFDISGGVGRMNCRPTIAHIAERNAAAGGHYFSRDTLRYFGQRRKDFKVHVRARRVFVQASRYKDRRYYWGESFAEFNPKTGDVRSVNGMADRTRESAANFLAGLK